MLRITVAAGVACAVMLWHPADAQFNTSDIGASAMPGNIVGNYRGTVKPVGNKLPAAAPQAGKSITGNAMMQPYDPNHPYAALKGANIDPNQVLAPLVGSDGKPVESPDALDNLSQKIKALWGLAGQAPARPPWVPGIARRNRERVHMMWRRD